MNSRVTSSPATATHWHQTHILLRLCAAAGSRFASSRHAAAAASPACPQSLTYTVVNSQNKKEKLSLLTDVGGYLLPGEMSALMG